MDTIQLTPEELKLIIESVYKKGFREGINAYSHMNNGVYYVGSVGKTLKEATIEIEETYNYFPPTTNQVLDILKQKTT